MQAAAHDGSEILRGGATPSNAMFAFCCAAGLLQISKVPPGKMRSQKKQDSEVVFWKSRAPSPKMEPRDAPSATVSQHTIFAVFSLLYIPGGDTLFIGDEIIKIGFEIILLEG